METSIFNKNHFIIEIEIEKKIIQALLFSAGQEIAKIALKITEFW